jgi:hypothetical protein
MRKMAILMLVIKQTEHTYAHGTQRIVDFITWLSLRISRI